MKWTDEKIKILCKRIDEGVTYNEISKELGTTYAAISNKVSKLKNIESKNVNFTKWTFGEIEQLISMKKNGMTYLQISEKLDRSVSSIEAMLKRQRKKIHIPRSERIDKLKNIDWDYFTEESIKYEKISDLLKSFNISTKLYYSAIKKGFLTPIKYDRKTVSKKKRKYSNDDKSESYHFRLKCKFKFNVYMYPDYFDLDLIENTDGIRLKIKVIISKE